MESTTVLSLSWREGGPELLGSCTVPLERRPELLRSLAEALKAQELVYIVTCNRVEVAYRSTESTPIESARGALRAVIDPSHKTSLKAWRAWRGEGAIEHLLLVACGLTSANIGETEISGQLRESLRLSRDLNLGGGALDQFIEEALRCAKRVRRDTALAEGRTSLAEIAIEKLKAHRAQQSAPYKVGLLGRSTMTERVATSLQGSDAQIAWINRSPNKIAELAKLHDATVHSLEEFCENPAELDVLVCATGATSPLLSDASLGRLREGGASLIIDLSVLPDVKKDDALRAGIEHFGLDEILTLADKTRTGKALAAADARVLVDEALDQITARSRARAADQAASLLHEKFRAEAAVTADESLAKEFKHLGPLDTERLRRFADLLARKLAHDPAKGLKRLAATHGREATAHFLDEDPRRER